jgi:hypothetical protein
MESLQRNSGSPTFVYPPDVRKGSKAGVRQKPFQRSGNGVRVRRVAAGEFRQRHVLVELA